MSDSALFSEGNRLLITVDITKRVSSIYKRFMENECKPGERVESEKGNYLRIIRSVPSGAL